MTDLLDVITCGNISCGIAKTKRLVAEAQKLRYDMLIMDFNDHNSNAAQTDASPYDDICDHLVAIDNNTGKVVGTYRVLASYKQPKQYVSEHEFDLTKLKSQPDGIIELSRAVVHSDYRNGIVIKMLWRALFAYCQKHSIRYLFGTASFHGVDASIYANSLAWLNDKYLVDKSLDCSPVEPCVKFGLQYDLVAAKEETPSLIKGYLAMGAKVASGAYIDYEFGSVDVLTIMDLNNVGKMFERIMR